MKPVTIRLIAGTATAAFLCTAGPTALSQPPLMDNTASTVNGLWRDADGGMWCGGSCAFGQKCCTITVLQ